MEHMAKKNMSRRAKELEENSIQMSKITIENTGNCPMVIKSVKVTLS